MQEPSCSTVGNFRMRRTAAAPDPACSRPVCMNCRHTGDSYIGTGVGSGPFGPGGDSIGCGGAGAGPGGVSIGCMGSGGGLGGMVAMVIPSS